MKDGSTAFVMKEGVVAEEVTSRASGTAFRPRRPEVSESPLKLLETIDPFIESNIRCCPTTLPSL
jgi:hypothetical protein